MPQILNLVKVKTLTRPPFCCSYTFVLWVVVLLHHPSSVELQLADRWPYILLQNLFEINFGINFSVNDSNPSRPWGQGRRQEFWATWQKNSNWGQSLQLLSPHLQTVKRVRETETSPDSLACHEHNVVHLFHWNREGYSYGETGVLLTHLLLSLLKGAGTMI